MSSAEQKKTSDPCFWNNPHIIPKALIITLLFRNFAQNISETPIFIINMKKILFVLTLALVCITDIQAEGINCQRSSKCNIELEEFLQAYRQKGLGEAVRRQALSASPEQYQKINVVLYCNDQASTIEKLEKMGIQAETISPSTLTAFLPVDKIETIADFSSVKKMVGLDKKELHLNNARIYTGVLQAHKGTGLDTPYTGKGVIVGLLDQGIQYDHAAFRTTGNKTRIIAALVLSRQGSDYYNSPEEVLLAADDGMDASHGTHVAGIMAGGKTLGSKTYYGMAPDAEIVAVSSSTLSDADMLTGIKYTKEVAAQEGKPWVFNMSIGTNLHFHDGLDEICLQLDTFVMNGGHIVASAGNDGGQLLHAQHTFSAANESKFLLINHEKSKNCYPLIMSNSPVGFNVDVFIYNTQTRQFSAIPDTTKKKVGFYKFSGDTSNCFKAEIYIPTNEILDDYTSTDKMVALKITGLQAGQTINAWGQSNYGIFASAGSDFITPDSKNIISSPSIAKKTISVGSYTTSTGFTNIDGGSYGIPGAEQGKLSAFSSIGPTMREDLQKPDICAPGQILVSSIKKNCSEFADGSSGAVYIVEKVNIGTDPFYYAAMQGTSMAAPATTGIIALWLQANPSLTHDQIMEVLQESSSAFTGQTAGTWDSQYGFGKIQAYTGLKKVLTMPTAIASVRNTESPVTFWKGNSEWKILFNSGETFANIQLCSLDGRIITRKTLNNISRGQEEILSLEGLAKGVYVIDIHTQNSNISRKVLVE